MAEESLTVYGRCLMRLPKEFQYAYHRTKEENVSSIARNGFTPGWGDMYGRGWYMCYDLDSQLNPNMTHYGDAVIRSELFPKGLLIFDYNVAKKVYGSDYSLVEQAKEQKIWASEEEMPPMFIQMSRVLEESFKNPKFSAAIAANSWMGGVNPFKVGLTSYADKGWRGNPNSFLDSSKGTPKNKKITSIMFTGNHDGNVVVVYNPDTAKPIDYAILSKEALSNLSSVDDIDWIPLAEAEAVTKRVDLTRQVFDEFHGKCLGIEIDPSSKIRTLASFKSKFSWLMKADFTDAIFRVDNQDRLHMKAGIWKGGNFKGYTMYSDVIFSGGVFEGELFVGQWRTGRWGLQDDAAWGGYSDSKSSFIYMTEDDEFVKTKESPSEFFNK